MNTRNRELTEEILSLYETNSWMKNLRKIRNDLVHRGELTVFESHKFNNYLYFMPVFDKRSSALTVIQIWNDVINFTKNFLQCISK